MNRALWLSAILRWEGESIEGRTLVTALGTADAVILVDLDDLAAHPGCDLLELALLVGGGLIDRRDAKIEDGSFHRLFSRARAQ